jgi:predicted nuclease of restriction endonuclease-like (RecB) superfamily
VLEFLDLPESNRLLESDLETALISRLQDFLLELGSGFAFIGRQVRITLDGDHSAWCFARPRTMPWSNMF